MLELETQITITDALSKETNLCSRFSEDDLKLIGAHVWKGYQQDLDSRAAWERRTSAAMDLALQVQKDKSFPWPNASNIAFPLVTIAALQYHSRAYPSLLKGPDLVKMRVMGGDPDGNTNAAARRVEAHMSWQLLEEDTDWEEGMDRLQINIPIVGCAFKKTYFDGEKGHIVSDFVMARDLVLDYYAKSVETCARKTQVIPVYRMEMVDFCLTGVFRKEVLEEPWFLRPTLPATTAPGAQRDTRVGQRPPATADESTPFRTLEQHCWLDLDQDGTLEPYIVTIEEVTKTVLRIVARWNSKSDIRRLPSGRIVGFHAEEYYTKYPFIPSPDGGVYDIGFGVLLGPLNESVNSIVNQLVDAGTLANTAGGFLGRGAKIRGGSYRASPFTWQRVDSTGDDLRKDIFPLPVREPSTVLFQLLSLLINYANRIPGTTEVMTGENPGQNTPASTTQALVEQGAKIFTAIFKRQWRAMRDELKKRYVLNGLFLPENNTFGDKGQDILRADYLYPSSRLVPACDPEVASDFLRLQRIMQVKQAAMSTPGYDLGVVERTFLRELRIENVDLIYPGKDKVPPLPNPKMMVEQLKMEHAQKELQFKQQQFMMELQLDAKLTEAKIIELQARAMKEAAEAQGVEAGHRIAAFEAAIGALKSHHDSVTSRIEAMTKALTNESKQTPTPDSGGMGGMAAGPGDAGLPGMGPALPGAA